MRMQRDQSFETRGCDPETAPHPGHLPQRAREFPFPLIPRLLAGITIHAAAMALSMKRAVIACRHSVKRK